MMMHLRRKAQTSIISLDGVIWMNQQQMALLFDSSKPNMNLNSWKGTVVRKQNIYTAKNYLTEDELDSLNGIVTIFLESAELHVKMRKDLTMDFWEENADKIITDYSLPLLDDKGSRPAGCRRIKNA
jgi:hypothetical protein